MTFKASRTLLNRLKALYPSQGSIATNPWYIVAATAFSASNEPSAVLDVFKFVMDDSKDSERLLLARRFRDALFKSGLTSGYARAINSLIALHEVTPPELQDKTMLREPRTFEEQSEKGREFFKKTYGDASDSVQGLLDAVYPDLGFFSNTIGYGLVYGFISSANTPSAGVLSAVETSYVLVSSLIASDTPLQINWHLDGARRNGATLEEVKAVRQIAIEASEAAGVRWKNAVPEVKLAEVEIA